MNRLQLRRTAVLTGMLFALPLTAVPAAAQQDAGTLTRPTTTTVDTNCPLERVGTELVRCDLLTGNGVPAAFYIPERRSPIRCAVPSLRTARLSISTGTSRPAPASC